MRKERQIVFHNKHFNIFYAEQSPNVRKKINNVFRIVQQVERIPQKFFSYMEGTDGLYEIKIEFESNIYRIFCCFDEGNIIVLFNAFQKKTEKTPKRELEIAVRLKREYFELKSKQLL